MALAIYLLIRRRVPASEWSDFATQLRQDAVYLTTEPHHFFQTDSQSHEMEWPLAFYRSVLRQAIRQGKSVSGGLRGLTSLVDELTQVDHLRFELLQTLYLRFAVQLALIGLLRAAFDAFWVLNLADAGLMSAGLLMVGSGLFMIQRRLPQPRVAGYEVLNGFIEAMLMDRLNNGPAVQEWQKLLKLERRSGVGRLEERRRLLLHRMLGECRRDRLLIERLTELVVVVEMFGACFLFPAGLLGPILML